MKYKKIVSVKMPTQVGSFKLVAFQNSDPNVQHLALVKGRVKGKENILIRVHSSCITGDIFGSCRCDCGPQLLKAMKIIENEKQGAILYLFQEGRGIGLLNKLKAYKLQEKGLDTVDANLKLGLPVDMRDYQPAADMVQSLGIKSVRLLTNNPDKISKLRNLGVTISKRVECEITPVVTNEKYLFTKKQRMGHILNSV